MISPQRWRQFSLSQQLGHVASEIARARHWEEEKDELSRNHALERALELIDLTVTDERFRKRLKEILRLREVVCDWYSGTGTYLVSPRELEEYCQTYAFKAL